MADVATQLQQAVDQPDYGENFEKLPEDRIGELRSILQTCKKRDTFGRMIEVIRCTLRRNFWLGHQNQFWNADTQQFQVGPNGGSLAGENLNEENLFQGDFNIYTQNGKIFMAVFSQSAATTRMEADKPRDPASVKAAQEAEKYVQVYEKYNPPKVAQMEVAKLAYTDGRIISVTRYDEDPDISTTDEDGNPVPFCTELTKYHGVLETKVPLIEPFAKWPYCGVFQDIDVLTAQSENPQFADKIKQAGKGTQNDEIARMSRIATTENVSQVSSDTLASLVTEENWYLRPSAFWDLNEAQRGFWIGSESTDKETGEVTKTEGIFPRGCRVKFFGDVYCGAEPVAMSAEVRCLNAMPGKGNARPSLSDAMVPIQMEFNDAVGMYSEAIHKVIPRTWINITAEEIQAILEQAAKYGEYSPFTTATGMPLEHNFFTEPAVQMPEGFEAWLESLSGPWSQFVTGNSPALWGAQMEDQKTAHGYAQAKHQAEGLMAISWVPYVVLAAGIREQAGRCAANRDTDKISAVIPDSKGKTQTLDVDTRVMKGGFLCSPVIDQNFPQSGAEMADKWESMMAAAPTNPVLAQQLMHPDNLVAMRDAIGMKNFVIQGADSRDVQLAEWAKMQEGGGPVEDQQATMQRDQQKQQMAQQAIQAVAPGMQPPPLPQEPPVMSSTVPIDEDTDDHVVHALEMFRILNSPEGQKIKLQSPPVWQDGKLHMLAHVAAAIKKGIMMPPPLGAPPPMLPPGKPGAGAPPPPGGNNAPTDLPAL